MYTVPLTLSAELIWVGVYPPTPQNNLGLSSQKLRPQAEMKTQNTLVNMVLSLHRADVSHKEGNSRCRP